MDGLGKLLAELVGATITDASIASMFTDQRWPLCVFVKTDRGSVAVSLSEGHVTVASHSGVGQGLSPGLAEARTLVAETSGGRR